MSCLLQVTTGKSVRYYPQITFYAHNFKDIADLSGLCKPYKAEMLKKNPMSKIPDFSFLLDPSEFNHTQLLDSENFLRKEEL